MKATLFGILIGILAIILIALSKGFDKRTLYGLTLTGIGFLYVGFTWSDPLSLTINIFQALAFVFISCYGINRSIVVLIAGYLLHGAWDLGYSYLPLPALRPPHYDLFCLAVDFTMGLYLMVLQRIAPNIGPSFENSSVNIKGKS